MGLGPGHQNKYNPGYHKGDNRAGGGGSHGGGGKNTRSPLETRRGRAGGTAMDVEKRERELRKEWRKYRYHAG